MVNRIHDLPGMRFADTVDTGALEVQASVAVPRYFAAYEKAFDLPGYRPVKVTVVCNRGERLRVETDGIEVSARGIINAMGTWETPHIPKYPGADRFWGRQLHARDYRGAEEFAANRVIVVGAGISAIQLLDEVPRATTTTWVTRREPDFHPGPLLIVGPSDDCACSNSGRRARQISAAPARVQTGGDDRRYAPGPTP